MTSAPPVASPSPPIELERMDCPRCGKLLGKRAPGTFGLVELRCSRCSWLEGRPIYVRLYFVVEITGESELQSR